MRIQTFVIASALALTIFLFAQHRTGADQASPGEFRSIVDLTRSSEKTAPATLLKAPSAFAPSLWAADQIPAQRLIAPLAVLDVHTQAAGDPDYRVSMDDIIRFEHANGHVPQGAVVMARTGWNSSPHSSHFPGYSEDAAKFLVEARGVMGLGIDTTGIDPSAKAPVQQYTLSHSVYQLANVANLDLIPVNNATVVVAPVKASGPEAPVRIFALVR